jgi:hypothetical protein
MVTTYSNLSSLLVVAYTTPITLGVFVSFLALSLERFEYHLARANLTLRSQMASKRVGAWRTTIGWVILPKRIKVDMHQQGKRGFVLLIARSVT